MIKALCFTLLIILLVICFVFIMEGITNGFSKTCGKILIILNLNNTYIILKKGNYFNTYVIFAGSKFYCDYFLTESDAINYIRSIQEEKLKKRIQKEEFIGEYSGYDLVDDSLKKQLVSITLKEKLK